MIRSETKNNNNKKSLAVEHVRLCMMWMPGKQFRRLFNAFRPHLNFVLSSFSSLIALIFGMKHSFDIIYSNDCFVEHETTKTKQKNEIQIDKYFYFLFFLFASPSTSRWFCHFDDDNYVNVPQLVQLLNEYHPTMDWYLGKPSVASPLEIHLDAVSRQF